MDLEKILLSYVTHDWRDLLNSVNVTVRINVWILSGVLVVLALCLMGKGRSSVSSTSHECQTEACDDSSSTEPVCDVLNMMRLREKLVNIWRDTFTSLEEDKSISHGIVVSSIDLCESEGSFELCELTQTRKLAEFIALSFRVRVSNAVKLIVNVKFDEDKSVRSLIQIERLQIKYQVMLELRNNREISVKLSPEEIGELELCFIGRSLSEAEKEMRKFEFERDFRVVLMRPAEFKWSFCQDDKEQVTKKSEAVETAPLIVFKDDKSCQADDTDFHSSSTNAESSVPEYEEEEEIENEDEDSKFVEAFSDDFILDHQNRDTQPISPNKGLLHTEMYGPTTRDIGEASPFHERFQKRLIGRTLILKLMRIVNVAKAKVPKRKGFWSLELNEPYQNQMSHMKQLASSNLVWDQNFVFNLNSNSQRLFMQLKCIDKKGKKTPVYAACLLSVNDIIFSSDSTHQNHQPSWHYIPLHLYSDYVNSAAGSTSDDQLVLSDSSQDHPSSSLRCDSVPGLNDGVTPALQVSLQVMVHDTMPMAAGPVPVSEKVILSDFVAPETRLSAVKLREPRLQSRTKTLASRLRNRFSFMPSSTPASHSPMVMTTSTEITTPTPTNQNNPQTSFDRRYKKQRTRSVDRLEIGANGQMVWRHDQLNLNEPPELQRGMRQQYGGNKKKIGPIRNLFFKSHPTKIQKSKEKSLEKLFAEKDPKNFEVISQDGYNKVKKL